MYLLWYLREKGLCHSLSCCSVEVWETPVFFWYAHWWWIGGKQIPSHEDLEIKTFILVTCGFSKSKYSTHQVSKILTTLDIRIISHPCDAWNPVSVHLLSCSFSPAARTPWCMSDLRKRSIRRVFLGLNDMISAVSSTVYRNPLEHCILACPK